VALQDVPRTSILSVEHQSAEVPGSRRFQRKVMIRDPLYSAIEEGLSKPLDWAAFEACAESLLRPIYPTLVPVPGGGDAGIDGYAAELDAPPIVLVTTTAQDVERNFRTNLESHVKSGGRARCWRRGTGEGRVRSRSVPRSWKRSCRSPSLGSRGRPWPASMCPVRTHLQEHLQSALQYRAYE